MIFSKWSIRNKKVKINANKSNGITLIALVITIIVLIILAGVAINLTLGQNGLLNRTKEAREKYEIASAKEYIELKIDECIIEKGGEASLQDIIDYLAEDSSVTYYVALEEVGLVAGEIDIGSPKEIYVVYNRYQFKVDESKKVEFISIVDVDLEGKVSIEAQVKEHLGKNSDGKYEASVLLKATGDAEIEKLEIQNPDGTTLTLEPDGLTTVGKDMTIEFDKTYKVILTTANGHKYTKKIIEKSEETIMNAEQLSSFRDKVNSGLTYEGKTVKLGADIDLSTVCGANVNGKEVSWEPIGTETISFKGTLDGNYKAINNLHINSNENNETALLRCNIGYVKNIILKNVEVYNYTKSNSKEATAAIIATNYGTIENCTVLNGNVKYQGEFNSESYLYAGAIAARNYGTIKNCYNGATINSINTNRYADVRTLVGGIAGATATEDGKVSNCYNKGTINVEGSSRSAAGGIAAQNANGATIENCYNYGAISKTGSALVGGVVGRNRSTALGIIKNSYCIENTRYSYYETESTSSGKTIGMVNSKTLQGYASTLGEAFTNDVKVKVIDESTGEEKEVWKYNDGYPILKWQLQENQVTE